MEKLMTIKDVAEFMQQSPITIRRLIAKNEIPHIRIGSGRGSIRIMSEELEKYIKNKAEVQNAKIY